MADGCYAKDTLVLSHSFEWSEWVIVFCVCEVFDEWVSCVMREVVCVCECCSSHVCVVFLISLIFKRNPIYFITWGLVYNDFMKYRKLTTSASSWLFHRKVPLTSLNLVHRIGPIWRPNNLPSLIQERNWQNWWRGKLKSQYVLVLRIITYTARRNFALESFALKNRYLELVNKHLCKYLPKHILQNWSLFYFVSGNLG